MGRHEARSLRAGFGQRGSAGSRSCALACATPICSLHAALRPGSPSLPGPISDSWSAERCRPRLHHQCIKPFSRASTPFSPAQAFPVSPENEYGHLRLHDFSDAVARLPPEEIHGMAGGEPRNLLS